MFRAAPPRIDGPQAGFTILEAEDQTELWRDFTASRLQAFRNARPAKVAVLGADLADGLEDFYAVMAGLFSAGAVGGLRLMARRAAA